MSGLLLLAFDTALAQVSPVDVRPVPAGTCGCCQPTGDGGMPDRLPAPVAAPPVFNFERPARTVRAAATVVIPASRRETEKFYARFPPRASVDPVRPVSLALALPAGVPLFRERCSGLI